MLGRAAEDGVGYETPLLSLTRLETSIAGGVAMERGGGRKGFWRCGATDMAIEEGASPQGKCRLSLFK